MSTERLTKLCHIREMLRRGNEFAVSSGSYPTRLEKDFDEALDDINLFILEEKNGSTR
jgi:hypothetical protein